MCSLVSEGANATVSCPSGQTISQIGFATFGTFTTDSSCTSVLEPLSACPTSVIAQISRLCVGSASCTVACACSKSPCSCVSSTPSFKGDLLQLAFPGAPCTGIVKQLGIIASCAPSLPPPAPQPAFPALTPTNLLLEFLPSPVVGLDNLVPHFAWTPPASTARLLPAAVQAAARVVVTTWPTNKLVWDSGPVATTSPLLLPSSPLPLASDSRYAWTVSTADSEGRWTPRSEPARFNTGLLKQEDWGGAQWIAAWRPGTLLRKDFSVVSAPSRISVFVSACQYYLLYLDGQRIGTNELDVAWTRFPLFR
jgi:hypothetical protein